MDLQPVIDFAIAMWSEPGLHPPSFSLDCVRQFLRGAASRFPDAENFLDTILELSKESRDSTKFRVEDLRRALEFVARAQSIPDFTLNSLKSKNFSETAQPLSSQFVCIGIPRPTPKQILTYDFSWPLTPEKYMDKEFATLVWSTFVEDGICEDADTSGISVVDHVWTLIDSKKTGSIGRNKFVIGTHLMEVQNSGNLLPHAMPDAAADVLQSWIEEARSTIVTSRIATTTHTQTHNMHDRIMQSVVPVHYLLMQKFNFHPNLSLQVVSPAGESNISDGPPPTLPTPPISTDPAGSGSRASLYSCCPFCEEELPKHLPNYLQCKLAEVLLASNSQPSPTNENPALREPTKGGFQLCTSFCADHLGLTRVTAAAVGQAWPSRGDVLFPQLEARVRSLVPELSRLVCYPSESPLFRRLVKMIEAEGLAEVRSLDGQLRRMPFEHAGYYGERGSLIIHRALLKMFPDASDHRPIFVDPARIRPLDHAEFFMSVLVPKTSILLIQQDKGCSWSAAKDHWKASRQYGLVMFRDEDELIRLPF